MTHLRAARLRGRKTIRVRHGYTGLRPQSEEHPVEFRLRERGVEQGDGRGYSGASEVIASHIVSGKPSIPPQYSFLIARRFS
jgi:hypothetical protein